MGRTNHSHTLRMKNAFQREISRNPMNQPYLCIDRISPSPKIISPKNKKTSPQEKTLYKSPPIKTMVVNIPVPGFSSINPRYERYDSPHSRFINRNKNQRLEQFSKKFTTVNRQGSPDTQQEKFKYSQNQ